MKKKLTLLFLLFIGNKSIAQWKTDKTNTFRTDISQFTDFLGFKNDLPNGLFQQQFQLKIPINPNAFFFNNQKSSIQVLRSVVTNIVFNRIEKTKNDPLQPIALSSIIDKKDSILKAGPSSVISTFDILRYNSFQFDTRWVLLGIRHNNAKFYIDGRLALLRNTLGSPYFKGDSTKAIYSFLKGISLYFSQEFEKDKIKLFFEAGYNEILLKDSFFKQYDVATMSVGDVKKIALSVEKFNRGTKPIWYGKFTIQKDWGEKKDNNIYFRIQYHYQTFNFTPDRKTEPDFYHNHYLQLQAGVSLSIDQLFAKK